MNGPAITEPLVQAIQLALTYFDEASQYQGELSEAAGIGRTLYGAYRAATDDDFSRMLRDAKATGTLQLSGELSVDINLDVRQAYAHLQRQAEECGYCVGYFNGCRSMLIVSGGINFSGSYLLDYYDTDRPLARVIRQEEREGFVR